MKKLVALALVMVLALSLLTACGGNSNTPSGGDNTPSGNNSTPGGNESTPGGNNNNGGDSAIGYPDEWKSEIPKMNGTVTFKTSLTKDSLKVFVDVKNEDVINAYIDTLISAGYEKTNEVKDDNHRTVGLTNKTWAIVIDYGITSELEVQLGYSPYVG